MKEKLIKLIQNLNEEEIKELVDAINEYLFEYGWNKPTKNLRKLEDACWHHFKEKED